LTRNSELETWNYYKMGRKSEFEERQPSELRDPGRYEQTAASGDDGFGVLPARSSMMTKCLCASALIAAVFLAYLPAWHNGFIWDDDDYITSNKTLRDVKGLERIKKTLEIKPDYVEAHFNFG
jgi:hypothetical protein